jgi:hypothetical protein
MGSLGLMLKLELRVEESMDISADSKFHAT